MLKKITKKQKVYTIFIVNFISILFLLPIFIGFGCDTTLNYKNEKYNVTGYCNLGLLSVYYLPKDKAMNENHYVKLYGIYMKYKDNGAVYFYDFDDSNMLHNRQNIRSINRLKYKRYYQFRIIKNGNNLILKKQNGVALDLIMNNDTSKLP